MNVTKELVVWWPVTVTVPADNGQFGEETATLQLRVPRRRAHREISARQFERGEMTTARVAALEAEIDAFVGEHVLDWREVNDADGKPLPFSAEAFAAVCDSVPGFAVAVAAALGELALGKPPKKT